MNRTLRVLFAALVLYAGAMGTAQAGQSRAEKYCSRYKSDRDLKTEKTKKDGVQIKGGALGVGGGLEHSRSDSTEQQALPEDMLRKGMLVYNSCLDWKSGILTKDEFRDIRLNSLGMKSDQDRRDEEAAQEQAKQDQAAAQKRTKRDQRQRVKDERARNRARSRAKARRWVALGSAAVALGGGALVLTTTQTARDTQAVYGPENEWDDLKRLNTIGWYAAAGGLVIMKISLSAGGPGFAIHGAF
jgi:hypothetical protein